MRLAEPGVFVTHVQLSIGPLDLFRFERYAHVFPRHAHERYTFGVFDGTNGIINCRHASWAADAGAILAIAPDEPHSAEPDRSAGWTYRSLYPSSGIIGLALDGEPRDAAFARTVFHDDALATELVSLHRAIEETPGATESAEERLLVLLRRLMSRHATARLTPATAPSSVAMGRAREYLEANFDRPLRLAELAVECGVSPFHLIRSFYLAVGMTPHAYLTQVRANRARELLLAGEPISSVAYRCQFSDQSHLTRVFKRITGVTPGAYVGMSSRTK
jgi:AraC-like DNA-binding protein